MNKRRFQRTVYFAIVVSLLLGGACVLWLRAQQCQHALNRHQIAALVRSDDKQALFLVNAGADPNARYEPLPMKSLNELIQRFRHRAPSLKQLVNQLRHPTSPPKGSPTSLMFACRAWWDDPNIALQHDDPDSASVVQATQSHGAQVNVRARFLRELLVCGADPNLADKDGKNPLSFAQSWVGHACYADSVALLKQTRAKK